MASFSPADPAAVRIREAAGRDALSHALLFTGDGDLTAAARYAAAALECRSGETRPCGVCPACRKVFSDIHPDVTTVRDEKHKYVAVDMVRSLRADAYVRPNEGRRKVYIFPDCALLTEQDQNVMLKIVEEGPPYAAFLLLADNAGGLLPTVRSRCEELALTPASKPERADGELRALAEKLALVLDRGSELELFEAAMLLDAKRGREELSCLLDALEIELGARAVQVGNRKRLLRAAELVKELRGAARLNVNAGQLSGWLCAGMYENKQVL